MPSSTYEAGQKASFNAGGFREGMGNDFDWRVSTMSSHATWKPHTEKGELSTADKNDLPESVFAFPKQRKEPLTDAHHVQNALARFDQVKDVSDSDRDLAFANIKKAAD